MKNHIIRYSQHTGDPRTSAQKSKPSRTSWEKSYNLAVEKGNSVSGKVRYLTSWNLVTLFALDHRLCSFTNDAASFRACLQSEKGKSSLISAAVRRLGKP